MVDDAWGDEVGFGDREQLVCRIGAFEGRGCPRKCGLGGRGASRVHFEDAVAGDEGKPSSYDDVKTRVHQPAKLDRPAAECHD